MWRELLRGTGVLPSAVPPRADGAGPGAGGRAPAPHTVGAREGLRGMRNPAGLLGGA